MKVLIADDEPYVRKGLMNIIEWDKYGFVVCGEGVDGDDTYQKICELRPELVLIDIKMPGKSGLEVIKDTVESGLNTKFIIVSGHSEFEYAKEAMKYGVGSYLLKPVDEDELIGIILEVSKRINDEITERKSEINKNVLIKEYVLSQLCLANITTESEKVIQSIKANSYVIALVNGYNNSDYNESITELEKCIKQKLVVNSCEIFKVKNEVGILFKDKNIKSIFSILEKLRIDIKRKLCAKVFITIGHPVSRIDDIQDSYNDALYLMKKKYLYLQEGIIYKEKIDKKIEVSELNDEKILEKLYTYIEIAELTEIKRLMERLEKYIIEKDYNENMVKVTLTTYYVKVKDKILGSYNLDKKFINENDSVIENIYNKESLHEVIQYLSDIYCDISKSIAITTLDRGIKRVIKYVDNKYYSDLKLEGLAEVFNYNSSYLGKLFKDSTGKNFNTYLDNLRIEQAKKLLKDDNLKVYEVCEKVGYKNIDYFYSKFKKYVGVSPLNYKKILEKK